MNLFTHFENHVSDAIGRLQAAGVLPEGADLPRITVEPTQDAAHGDISTNAAMVLAKAAKMPPRELAARLAEQLRDVDEIEAIEVAGPGFLNFTLAAGFWPRIIGAILQEKEDYGRSDAGRGLRVNVEYVSANPTGPLHIGHCRGAVFGDVLATLLAHTGCDVTREYYVNDAGGQVDTLARSVYFRYREALGEDIGAMPEGLYPGEYLKPLGQKLVDELGDTLLDQSEGQWLPTVRDASINAMMALVREDLALLGISHDIFFSERTLHAGNPSEIAKTIAELEDRNLVYMGSLPPPKGKLPDDWEDREQTLFRASDFGDDIDRPLVKSDGSYTYFAADIAYFRNKYERGFKEMVYVLGADHGDYSKRLTAVARALAGDDAVLVVRFCQLVKLLRDGVEAKMSKRAGDFVTVREVVEEVGPDAVRFMMLFRKNDAPLDFDFARVTENSLQNPVYYVQYAHARCHSILYRRLPEVFPDISPDELDPSEIDWTLLNGDGDIALIRRLGEYPRRIESAAKAHEPHRVARFLFDLAGEFHTQYARANKQPHLRYIRNNEPELTKARLMLIRALAQILASGLKILGIQPVDEMR